MMFTCFFCSQKGNLNFLRNHIKIRHGDVTSTFYCKEDGCLRNFDKLKSAYTHLKLKHLPHSRQNFFQNLQSRENDVIQYEPVVCSKTSMCNCVKISISDELLYVLKQYKKTNFTRKDITVLVKETKILFEENSARYRNFTSLDSEFKREQVLKDLDLMYSSDTILLYYEQKNKKTSVQKKVTAQYFRLQNVFNLIFICKQNLVNALEYLKSTSDVNYISDMKDSSVLNNIHKHEIPYVLYYDEVETNNPLGSHKGVQKIGVVYLALKCFPPHLCSTLDNIYVCAIFPGFNKDNLEKVMSRIIVDINKVYVEGMFIHNIKLKFRFVGLIGDNLGLHQVLGYVQSFSANYHCRLCRASKDQTRVMTKENSLLLRNLDNFENDILLDNPSETGVKANSVMNEIVGYHVTKNYFTDLMHDVFEGTGNIGMCLVIKHCVNIGEFSLDLFNNRLRMFDFGYLSNRPPPIKTSYLDKGSLPYSAAENLNLILYFGMIVGDKLTFDDVLTYWMTLREIVCMSLLKSFPKILLERYKYLISKHHELYQSIFNKHLLPKHHFMVHYPSVIEKTGPLSHNWCMRFEAKHFALKIYSTICRSRINLCRSLAVRLAFSISCDLFKAHDLKHSDLQQIGSNKGGNSYSWIIFRGIKYTVNDIICYDENNMIPAFGRITEINVLINEDFHSNSEIKFHLNCLSSIMFDEVVCGFHVAPSDLTHSTSLNNSHSISHPLVTSRLNSKLYVEHSIHK